MNLSDRKADYAFLCKNYPMSIEPFKVTDSDTAAVRFTLPAGCSLTSLYGTFPSWSDNIGSMDLCLYRWEGNYASTVAGQPVYRQTIRDYVDNGRLSFYIPDGTVKGGTYLCVFCRGSENPVGVYFCEAPDNGVSGVLTDILGFKNGQPCDLSLKMYATLHTDGHVVKPDLPKTRLTPGKAHVIYINGQSNASGQSIQAIYKTHADPAVYAQFEKGFPHILIDVAVDGGSRETDGFVPVAFGQGSSKERFGPELGLAQYLDEKYPGETFYVIKSSWSGAGLTLHFAEGQEVYEYIMKHTLTSLERLKDMGLDPEVFALCWMQGETDSWNVEQTVNYADRQEDLIRRITERISPYVAPGGFAFLDAAISDAWPWTLNGIINIQKEICCSRSPNYYYLDTVTPGLGCEKENDDIAHYDSDDMIALGRMFGEAVSHIIEENRL